MEKCIKPNAFGNALGSSLAEKSSGVEKSTYQPNPLEAISLHELTPLSLPSPSELLTKLPDVKVADETEGIFLTPDELAARRKERDAEAKDASKKLAKEFWAQQRTKLNQEQSRLLSDVANSMFTQSYADASGLSFMEASRREMARRSSVQLAVTSKGHYETVSSTDAMGNYGGGEEKIWVSDSETTGSKLRTQWLNGLASTVVTSLFGGEDPTKLSRGEIAGWKATHPNAKFGEVPRVEYSVDLSNWSITRSIGTTESFTESVKDIFSLGFRPTGNGLGNFFGGVSVANDDQLNWSTRSQGAYDAGSNTLAVPTAAVMVGSPFLKFDGVNNVVATETNALQRIAANNLDNSASVARMARIDELSRLNYERRIGDAINNQEYVFRYLSEDGLNTSLKYGSVRG